jgi:hypothetical protein
MCTVGSVHKGQLLVSYNQHLPIRDCAEKCLSTLHKRRPNLFSLPQLSVLQKFKTCDPLSHSSPQIHCLCRRSGNLIGPGMFACGAEIGLTCQHHIHHGKPACCDNCKYDQPVNGESRDYEYRCDQSIKIPHCKPG